MAVKPAQISENKSEILKPSKQRFSVQFACISILQYANIWCKIGPFLCKKLFTKISMESHTRWELKRSDRLEITSQIRVLCLSYLNSLPEV